MKTKGYEVKINLRVSEYEKVCDGFHNHTIGVVVYTKNKLDAINRAMRYMKHLVTSISEQDEMRKKFGDDFRVRDFEIDEIVSVEAWKEEE